MVCVFYRTPTTVNYTRVNHAHWIGKNACVALKRFTNKADFEQEFNVLQFFKGINESENNYIIKMLGQ
uniref:Uncharacterized protein n=1 Tax=Meloidogyne enterolobii TaxID=390850 RepID=A0A6V7X635_MELEN|nr:unnamed protein product [Meloidogyne enterolobii]